MTNYATVRLSDMAVILTYPSPDGPKIYNPDYADETQYAQVVISDPTLDPATIMAVKNDDGSIGFALDQTKVQTFAQAAVVSRNALQLQANAKASGIAKLQSQTYQPLTADETTALFGG